MEVRKITTALLLLESVNDIIRSNGREDYNHKNLQSITYRLYDLYYKPKENQQGKANTQQGQNVLSKANKKKVRSWKIRNPGSDFNAYNRDRNTNAYAGLTKAIFDSIR
jgi:hypothetical protein